MSIKDTINAARREVLSAGGPAARDASAGDQPAAARTAGRRSAARARPARDAATSVRVVSADDAKAGRSGKRPSEMTREERKAERRAQRSEQDQRADAAEVLLKRQDDYRRRRRLYWILIGTGFALTLISFLLTRLFPLVEGGVAAPAIIAVVMLVVAYALIIGAFVFDWRKIRPMREDASAEASRLSNRKLRAMLSNEANKAAK